MSFDSLSRRRRWRLILVSMLVVIVAALVALAVSQEYTWVGRQKLAVMVLVADADTAKPLVGVPITVFAGPEAEDVFSLSKVSKVAQSLDYESTEVQRLATGEDGRVEFTRAFFAAGRKSWYWESGYIKTAGTWIEAAPPGYGAVLLPLDGQSVYARKIDQDMPVYVTIYVRKPKEHEVTTGQHNRTR